MKLMKYILMLILLVALLITAGAKHEKNLSIRAKVYDAPEKVSPVLVGTKIPDVTVRDENGVSVNLKEHTAQKPTVLVFYRGGWCIYCNRQLGQLMEIEKDILDAGFQIIAISPDKSEEANNSKAKHQMNYTLFSDNTADAAKAFGIAFRVDEPMLKKLKGYKIDINAASGYDHNILPVPAVFVIGKDTTIHFAYVNPVYSTRLHPSVLLAAVNAVKNDSK